MTEAVRPTGASMHPSTGAISGEVLMTPISLDRAINVTPGIPSASSGNLSHDMMGGPSLREKAAALTLALGMLGGAKLVFDSQSAKGQSPSPTPSASLVPSEGPITGVIDPCASPEPSPSPSPTPEPTTLIGMANNSNGETVVVSLPQAAPSAPPASETPLTDTNGDGVIDEKDTETAAIDCVPDGSPTPSAAPSEVPTPAPTPNLENYTLEHLYDKGYEPIKKNEFINIVSRNAPIILEFTKDDPEMDTVDKLIAQYEFLADDVINNPNPVDGGYNLAGTIKSQISLAKIFARSNIQMADAFLNVADGLRRFGQNYLDFGTKNPKKIDRLVDKLIREHV